MQLSPLIIYGNYISFSAVCQCKIENNILFYRNFRFTCEMSEINL